MTAARTYAVTHEIDYYGATSRLRVLSLTDDLAEAQAEAQALNDAACAPYDAWSLGHNEAGNRHVVYEFAGYIEYSDWSSFPDDLVDAACAICEERGIGPYDIEDLNDAVDEAAAQLGYEIAADDTDEGGTGCILVRGVGSDSTASQAVI